MFALWRFVLCIFSVKYANDKHVLSLFLHLCLPDSKKKEGINWSFEYNSRTMELTL